MDNGNSILTDNAIDLLKKRYFREDETTWCQLADRVATAVAQAESEKNRLYWAEQFFNMIYKTEFIPSTPCLINADKNNPGQLSSCFIIALKDTIESIYEANGEAAKIFQKNGGIGFNISVLRPKKSTVETSKGYSSGPVGFMEIFDITAKKVTENNIRKGAIKIDLEVWHPDIYEFIHCKDDTTKLNNMNISVGLTDKFMQAVKYNYMWQLKFPDYSSDKKLYDEEWDGDIEAWEAKGYPVKIYKEIPARELYYEIMQSAWKTGEPGVSFIDAMNRANPNPNMGKVRSTNPCLYKDSYLVTNKGLVKIKDANGLNIWNGENYVKSKTWKTGNKKVIKITTNSGFEYITTPDHKFLLANQEWCEAKDLLGKQITFDLSEKEWEGYNPYPDVNYEILGFEFGDGIYHKASGRMKYIYATKDLDDQVINIIEKEFNDQFYDNGQQLIINIPYGTIYAEAFYGDVSSRMIPDWILQLPKKEMADFIRGLMSANGCNLEKYHKIQLVSANKKMLQQVQQMLLLFGIKSKLWVHNKEHDVEFVNGTYKYKESYHLVISRKSYQKYLNTIGFIQDYKNGYFEYSSQDETLETVVSLEELGVAEVWDFTEPELHRGVCNGAFVHNCSEFSSIPYNSCNLGSINLAILGDTKEEVFKKLEELVPKAIRFLDNMITVNKLPLKKIAQVTKAVRSVGLGVMGLADLFYKLNIRYDSEEGCEFTDQLFEHISKLALKASMDLAEERGVYGAYNGSVWEKRGIKVRNSNFLSIAPTGSISFIAGVSGGIEPNFALVYTRLTNEGYQYYIVNEIFKKELEKRGLFKDEILEKIVQNHGSCQGIEEIPEDMQRVFVTSYDIKPEKHVKTVSIIQKHVDLSISKTVNLPNSATVEDIMDVYILAWELGLKGVTIYRDGSREGQVLTVGKKEVQSQINEKGFIDIEPAMEVAYGKRIKVKTGCGALWLFFFVNKENNLAEIWTQVSGGGCKANIESMSRLISLAFRSKIDPKHILDQLSSAFCKTSMDNIGLKSCGHVIAKQIKEFIDSKEAIITIPKDKLDTVHNFLRTNAMTAITDGVTTVEKKEIFPGATCPECGSKLVTVEGCVKCNNCFWSRCN